MAIIVTSEQIRAREKEKENERLRKQIENSSLVNYSLKIPKHIHLRLKQKLASDDKVFKDMVMKMIMEYIEK